MKLNPDDPRLTAYALDELPADDARQLESDLAESPDARVALDETRALAALLAEGLAAEAAQHPADTRLAETVQHHLAGEATPQVLPAPEPEPDNVVPLPRSRFPWGAVIAAAAACVVLATLFLPGLAKSKAGATKLAALSRPAETAPAAPAAPAPTPAVPAEPKPEAPRYADAPAPNAGESQPATGVRASLAESRDNAAPPAMSPELMRRYGLAATPARPADAAAAANPAPVPTTPRSITATPGPAVPPPPLSSVPRSAAATKTAVPGVPAGPANAAVPVMDPALMNRYGLMPSDPTRRGLAAGGGAVPPSPLALAQSPERARPTPAMRPGPAPMPMPMPMLTPPLRPQYDDYLAQAPDNPGYVDVGENPFRPVGDDPLSTFSLDVDTGSYANIRRFLNAGQLPPRDAVRLEEMINYFRYEVAAPRGEEPFGVTAEVAACPWAPDHRLVRLAIKARGLDGPRPAGNFVFLVDVSGSMSPPERLPLLKQALKSLVRRLSPADRVAIVTYASSAGVHLPSTSGEQKEVLLEAIDRLEPGGSTNGEGGVRSAYDVAVAHFIQGGVNRVLLCTDGDFNVGISNQNELVRLIAERARSGVFLTTLGVGTDNFKDALMRRLADHGNGSYHYLDSFEEAQRVLLGEMDATFVTVARDAKAQVEFNPAKVGSWRLLGYEKRLLAHQDFNDDTKDAGEIGAGHLVTVLYEIVPPGGSLPAGVDPLKYQRLAEPVRPAREVVPSDDLFTFKLRYQRPEGSRSTLLERAVRDDDRRWSRATPDFRFAAAVASFGMILRDSPNRGSATFDSVLELGRDGLGADPDGWRAEFLALVQKARSLAPRGPRPLR